MLSSGEAVTLLPVHALSHVHGDHKYDEAPDTLIMDDVFAHIEASPLVVSTGSASTVTTCVMVPVQPELVVTESVTV